jgi:hypothetical protein
MEQITVNELQNNLHIIFDRITHQHEVISVVRGPDHSVVLLECVLKAPFQAKRRNIMLIMAT